MGLGKSDCEPCRACRRVLWVFDKHVLPGDRSGTQIHLGGIEMKLPSTVKLCQGTNSQPL